MFNIGFSEMVLIAIIALIVIGPKQLPEVARTIGRFLNELRRSSDAIKDEFMNSTKSILDERLESSKAANPERYQDNKTYDYETDNHQTPQPELKNKDEKNS